MKSNFIKGHKINHRFNIYKDNLVLGISCYLHDSSVCFMRNGQIIYASQEERHTRIKNDNSFPFLALLNGLRYLQIEKNKIDQIIFHESLKLITKKEKIIIEKRL